MGLLIETWQRGWVEADSNKFNGRLEGEKFSVRYVESEVPGEICR